jgi:hydroxyacylglutathione hydrolase
VGMSGKPSSTIGFEKRWNPLLSLPEEQFVASLEDVPAKPAEIAAILRFNQGLQ